MSFYEICYVQMSYVCMSSGDFELWIFVFFFFNWENKYLIVPTKKLDQSNFNQNLKKWRFGSKPVLGHEIAEN